MIIKRQLLVGKLLWKSFVIHVWDLLHKTSLKASGMLSVIYATLWLIVTVTMCSDVWWLSARINPTAQSNAVFASEVSQHQGLAQHPREEVGEILLRAFPHQSVEASEGPGSARLNHDRKLRFSVQPGDVCCSSDSPQAFEVAGEIHYITTIWDTLQFFV